MNIDKKALIGFITEIEASRERAKAETRHQSDILKKAKEQHFDTKAIRKVLQRRAMSEADRDSLDLAIDTYERAMGSLASAQEAVDEKRMSAREAAEHYGVPRGALAVVTGAKNAISEPVAHDPETGEIIENAAPPGGSGLANPQPAPEGGVGAGNQPRALPCATTWGKITAAREAHEAAVEAAREAKREKRRQETARASRLAAITDSDMPDPPPFLRRQTQEAVR